MTEHERDAELLDRYWATRRASPASATRPAGLDPGLVAVVDRLERALRPPAPRADFAASLRHRLEVEAGPHASQHAAQTSVARGWSLLRGVGQGRPAPLAGLATAAALVAVFLVGLVFWASRPQTVSAREILDRARATATDVAASGLRSLDLMEESTTTSAGGETVRTERHLWFQASDRWRLETTRTGGTDSPSAARQVIVSDGRTVWTYDPEDNTVEERASPSGGLALAGPWSGEGRVGLDAILQQLADCYDPVVAGEETVAGRPAYVVDLGASACPSASVADRNGPMRLWVDRETFLVLKSEVRDGEGGGVVSASEVTSVRYNADLSADLFAFQPPAGAVVRGERPAPPPTSPSPAGLAGIRARVGYPVFIPTRVPDGLRPEPPAGGEQPRDTVSITYHAPDGSAALEVLNGPAVCCLDADGRKDGEPVMLPDGTSAHFLDAPPANGGPILWWQRDGAYVALSGPHLTRDDLVDIAASTSSTADLGPTEAVTARPTSNPVRAPGFNLLRPTWLPEPMTVREEHYQVMTPNGPATAAALYFEARSGSNPHDALTLIEQPADIPPPPPDPQAVRETIGSADATIVHRGVGCLTISWTSGDVALSLVNSYDPPGQPRYSCEQMRQVVASVR